jgi:hypothetical protein
MTVSSLVGKELSVNQICESAYRISGLINEHQSMTEARGRVARTLLEIVLDGLQAQNVPARSESFYLLGPLTAGTYKYTLPVNVLDVIGTAMYLPASTVDVEKAETELRLATITQEQWQTIATKDVTGTVPLRLYPHRAGAQVEAWLWPIPEEAGWVRLRVQRLLAQVNDGNATVELDRPWQQYLVYALAEQLCMANSQPLVKIQNFERKAADKLQECRGFSEEHVDMQMYVDHYVGWNR